MVQTFFPPPPFCNQQTIQKRRNESSCYLCYILSFYCIFVLCLLFILWKSVEHNQPLFRLAPSCVFPLTLILRTLLNYLYSCSLRLEYQKGQIKSGRTHCIKTFVVVMTINDMSCVAQAKMFFHCIYKNIEFIPIFIKVRLTKVLCNIFSCVLQLHFFTSFNHTSRSFYCLSVMFSYSRMFYCFCYWSTCGEPCRYIWGS